MKYPLLLTVLGLLSAITAVGVSRASDQLTISTIGDSSTATIGTSTIVVPPPVTVNLPTKWLSYKIRLIRHQANRCRSWFGIEKITFATQPATKEAQLVRRRAMKRLRYKACIWRWSWANQYDFHRAERVASRLFGISYYWLDACASNEGGHGVFVYNRGGSGAAGWMQFMPSTYTRMGNAAFYSLHRRGITVPSRYNSLYSMVGQALAAAWGFANGRSHEWTGAGC